MEEIVTLFLAEKRKATGKRIKPQQYSLSPTDVLLLQAVYHCKFITAEQILRYRGLSANSLPMIQTKLKLLSGHDTKQPSLPYVQRFYQARFTHVGSLPFIYALLPAGKRALVASGLDMGILKRMPKIVKRLPAEIDHHLVVNEVLIASLHLEKYEPRIHLSESVHDWKLKRRPFTVTLFQVHDELQPAIHYSFVPDGYFEFHLNLGDRIAPRRLFWEIDLDSHKSRRFKQKIAAYLTFFHQENTGNNLAMFEMYLWFLPHPRERRGAKRCSAGHRRNVNSLFSNHPCSLIFLGNHLGDEIALICSDLLPCLQQAVLMIQESYSCSLVLLLSGTVAPNNR